MKGQITIDRELCKGCTYCVLNCPKKIIEVDDVFNAKGFYPARVKEMNGCTGCALCAVVCPDLAIEVFREDESQT